MASLSTTSVWDSTTRKRDMSPIALLASRKSIDKGERDIRVDDYLNDKLQTITDFEDLDALIASIESQRVQLQDQVIPSFCM